MKIEKVKKFKKNEKKFVEMVKEKIEAEEKEVL